MHVFDDLVGILGTVPLVAATIPVAVGAGLAYMLRKDPHVAVAFFGDGATEEGHFHESLNMAALYKLPVVFVCENNLYASHLHISQTRTKDNIVESGPAHGMASEVLDGNDVQAVLSATRSAVQRARSGEGPTLLEMRTFRWRGHVGPSWDMDVGVKRNDLLADWLPKDPIARARRELIGLGATEPELNQIEADARKEVEHSVQLARLAPWPNPDTLHEHVFVVR